MPSIANITVKASNGTTDVVYTAKSPSAGEGVPAIWRNDAIGTAITHRPELRFGFKEQGKNRVGRMTMLYPDLINTAVAGVYEVGEVASFLADVKVPKSMTSANLKEFAHQTGNLVASAIIKSMMEDGSNAT